MIPLAGLFVIRCLPPPRRRFLAVAAASLLVGCASYTQETRDIRTNYRDSNYPVALQKLEESSIKSQDKNRLLYRLEKAMILDRLGEYDKSRALLIEADKIADELYTTSVTRTAASFVVNDAAADYSGEDYEKVAIHTELALSYISSQNLDAARVEAKKINNKLAQINGAYEDHKDRYGEDAFARYLSGIIYEAKGEIDDAIIDYWKAYTLYRGDFAPFVRGGAPDELVRTLYRLLVKRGRNDRALQLEREYPRQVALAKADLSSSDYGEVVIIHELGHIAVKSTQEFVIPFGRQIVRFSFPVIRPGPRAFMGATGVTDVSNNLVANGENTEDLDAIAQATLDDRRGRLIAKEAARLIAKGQLTEQAYKHFGPLGGIAANIFSVITETADTRSWTLLPEVFMISRLHLKPGKHTLKIQTGGRLGRFEDVNIKKGQIIIQRDVG